MRGIVVLGCVLAVFFLSTISLTNSFAQTANTCGINFVSGNSVIYGSLQSGVTSTEKTITLSNPGTVAGTLSVNGTSWKDSTQATIMNAANTKFANSSGTYSAKNPLSATLQNIGTLQPAVNTNTYWQLQANLLSPSFTGNLTQTMNFRVSCDGGSGGSQTGPTFADDFTSYATQSAADTAWTSSNTGNFQINIANDNLDIKTTAGVAAIYHDLGASGVSDTAWVLRNKLTLTTAGSTSLGLFWIMLSDNTSNAQASHNGLGYYLYDGDNNVYVTADNANRPDQSSNFSVLSPTISPSATTYYVEMGRLSATSFKVTFYSDSTYTTSLGTKTITVSSGITGLRYIKLMSYTTGAMVGTFDDVQFWNGVTQVPSSGGQTTTSYPDGLGNAADGTNTSITQSTAGKIGSYSYTFNGVSSSSVLGTSTTQWNFLHNGNPWSISFWMKQDSSKETVILDDEKDTNGFNISTGPNGVISTQIWNGASVILNTQTQTGAIPSWNTWYHYVMTYDGNMLTLYRNGAQIHTATKTGTHSTGNASYALEMGKGASQDAYYFNGGLDDMSIWNRTLLPTEISQLYNSGNGNTPTALSNLSGLKAYYNFEQQSPSPVLTNQAIPPILPVTFQDDFSSYITQASADASWTAHTPSANNQVNLANDNLDFDQPATLHGATNYAVSHDLGTVSSTDWVLRFTTKFSTITSPTFLFIGLSDKDHNTNSGNGQSEDFIGLTIYNNPSEWEVEAADNMQLTGGTYQSTYVVETLSTGTNYYWEIIRDSTNSVTVKRYADSTYSTVAQSKTLSGIPSSVTGQKYIVLRNVVYTGFGGTWKGVIDDVKFWNGISQIPPPLVQQTSYSGNVGYGMAISGTGNSKGGIKVNTGSTLIGKTVNTISLPIHRSGSPTGTYYAEVYASDGSTLKYTFGSGDIAALPSDVVTWKTFTNSASSYTIALNDKIVIRFSGGTHATNDLSLKFAESPSGSFDGTNTTFCYGNTCQNELTDADTAFKIWNVVS